VIADFNMVKEFNIELVDDIVKKIKATILFINGYFTHLGQSANRELNIGPVDKFFL
jgi:hypothetical protein